MFRPNAEYVNARVMVRESSPGRRPGFTISAYRSARIVVREGHARPGRIDHVGEPRGSRKVALRSYPRERRVGLDDSIQPVDDEAGCLIAKRVGRCDRGASIVAVVGEAAIRLGPGAPAIV